GRCGQHGPHDVDERTPVQGCAGRAGWKRFTPAVVSPYGMPRKMWTPLRVNPRTRPAVVSTMLSSVQTRVPSALSVDAPGASSPLSVVHPGRPTPRAAPPTTTPADLRSQSRRLRDDTAGAGVLVCCLLIDRSSRANAARAKRES